MLLDSLSASKSNAGDPFQALLLEPVRLGATVVLPQGSLFEGSVVKTTPARWLSRPGSLLLTFTELQLPGGDAAPVAAALSSVQVAEGSRMRLDSEGRLIGGNPGKGWAVINLGVAGGIAKASDDGSQLIIEAIVSTATDTSTAGLGRIVAGCTSGIFMLTRRGQDVVLPRFTEMVITFTRPLSVPAPVSELGAQQDTRLLFFSKTTRTAPPTYAQQAKSRGGHRRCWDRRLGSCLSGGTEWSFSRGL